MRILLVASLLASCGLGRKPAEDAQKNIVEFFPISELPQDMGEPVLIGASVADPADWPASMYAEMGNGRCTATIVGERSLLIAAHCVASGGTAAFTAKGVRYKSVCTHSKAYAQNPTADYALCLVEKSVEGVPFEVVNQDSLFVKMGDSVLLTGFGCTVPGGGGSDEKYRIGSSTVTQLPSGNSNDLVTRGGAALCFGDSGGPAFKYLDSAKTARKVISVNSRGDIATTSYLSSVASTEGKRFLKAWSDLNAQKICGVHDDAVGCRGLLVPPPSPSPPPPASECKKTYENLGVCLFTPGSTTVANCYKEAGKIFACLDTVITKMVN